MIDNIIQSIYLYLKLDPSLNGIDFLDRENLLSFNLSIRCR